MNKIFFTLLAITLVIFNLQAQDEARLLRFPATNGNQVVFTYSGNLYTVDIKGGIARKITNHNGFEMFAHFSPDGKNLAFTAQYDGNTEIYTMPADGGDPKRLTYTATLDRDDISDRMGPNNIVMTWTNDGKNIIYRSRKESFNDFVGQLFSVSTSGGVSTKLPLISGGFCSYSPDGKLLAFNRVFREFRTWKYYKGGMADDIWIFNTQTNKTENITNNISQDIFPMWMGEDIYFISDRDRIMNLFVYNTNTKQTTKVTDFKEYDIKFPSKGKNEIIFENGGYIYIYRIADKKIEKLNITIKEDFCNSRVVFKDASQKINSAAISFDGNKLLLGARGDIFTVPTKAGIIKNLTESSGAHDRNPVWSPDGTQIAYISDATGEFEIYVQKADGSEKPKQITKNADTYKYIIKWSPDSKKILWSDKMLRMQYVDVASGDITLVEKSDIWEFTEFNWSPDSKWIVYTRPQKNDFGIIVLFNTESKEKTEVTDMWYDSGQPVFSANGKFLFFVSNRDFNPIYSETEWNHAYVNMAKIYFVTLAADTKSPFSPETSDAKTDTIKPDKKKDDSQKSSNKGESSNVKIDKENLQSRIGVLPIKASNYFNLQSTSGCLYYQERGDNGITVLKCFDINDKKESSVGEFDFYLISANSKKCMLQKHGKYFVVNTPTDEIRAKEPIDLGNLKCWVDLKAEWKQIFYESWRQMRDFFYVSNMHGVNWEAMKKKYEVLLPYVNDRNDLNYIIGELIGELNVGHAYVGGGDKVSPEKIYQGLLGAEITQDASGYFKIKKILKGENWTKNTRSPLTEIGVNVKEGDFIISVNGKSVKNVTDIYQLLINSAEKQTELEINSAPTEKGSHKEIVIPVKNEADLYYYNWVRNNIEKVNKATHGDVGYIHIPDMSVEGLNEFAKYFYPQLSKKALIIDDRGNGGGNVSPMIIERLMREVTRANMSRNSTVPGNTPKQTMLGPKVVLINNYSASDGDLFPYGIKKHGVAKVVGVRSWGGVVGIRGSLPFIDGGYLNRPEFASYSSEKSEWIIEGHGVDPDIIIDNDPYQEFMGDDAQLNKAIEVILDELKNYKPIPEIPTAPDKTK